MADDGVIASLMLIHDLYPVRWRSGSRGARQRPPLHGVPRRKRRAARVEDGVARIRLEGSCDGCPASSSTLELAIKQALDEAAPDLIGIEVEGRSSQALPNPVTVTVTPLPMVGRPRSRAAAEAAWFDLDGLDSLGEGEVCRIAEIDVDGSRSSSRRSRDRLLAYRDSCPGCDAWIADGDLERGDARLPLLRAALLPAPRRALARRRTLHLEPVPLLAGGQGVQGGAGAHERTRAIDGAVAARRRANLVSRLRRLSAAGPARAARQPPGEHGRAAGEALRPLRDTDPTPSTPHARTSTTGGSSASARPAWRMRSGDPELRPDRDPRPSGSTTSTSPTSSGRASQIPIGLAFFLPTAPRGGMVALYPSPAGATESELDLDAWEDLCADNPVLDGLEPDAEALIVNRMSDPPRVRDRADRRVLRARRDDQGELGGDLGRRRAGGGDRRVLRPARRARSRDRVSAPDGEAAAVRNRTRRSTSRPTARCPSSRCWASSPVEQPPPRRFEFQVRATDRSALRVYMIALSALITIEPAKRRTTRDPRAADRAVRRARALGHHDDELPLDPDRRLRCPRFAESATFDVPVACTYDLEVAASKYFHGLEDGEAPLRFHFSGTVFYEAEDGLDADLQIPWDRSVRYSMPVKAWEG